MKAFKVKYHHGHFIDVESNKRLIPVQGKEYTITAEDNSFKSQDVKLLQKSLMDSDQKGKWVAKEYGRCQLMLPSGTLLFFRIGNSKRIEGDESHEYIFTCKLLEDLYIYKLKDKKGDEAKHWRLADCVCELVECINGGLALTENLRAQSLSMLFGYTVMFYFSLQRSASCNAFTTFFLFDGKNSITHEGIKQRRYHCIDDLRKDVMLKGRN